MWPAAEAEVKPSSVRVRALIDQRGASFLPSAEFREQIFNVDHGFFSGTCSPAVCVCVCVHMDKCVGWRVSVMYRAHTQLSSLYALRHARDFTYQALPLYPRATLKRREWPGDEATMSCFHVQSCLVLNFLGYRKV